MPGVRTDRDAQPRHDDTLARAQRGDRAACRDLVRRHERRVMGQLRAILVPAGRAAVVEDLAQETFLRAFRALPRFVGDGRARLSTWLATIATRVALNELRRRRPRAVELDTVAETLSSGRAQDRPDAAVDRAIEQAIADLPPAFRGAFLLRELHGLDYAEIAELCEVDLGTVKSRLSRARARLREALGARGEDA
jgi:RNA polymerase sigma-70 factor, ECF subfamily